MKVDQKPTMINQKKDGNEKDKKCFACGGIITTNNIRVAYKDSFFCFECFDKAHREGKYK